MHVAVGPVSSASALAFIGYARDVIERGAPANQLPADVAAAFTSYLDEWEGLARTGRDFTWETTVAVEVAEYLVHAFYRLAQRLEEAARARGPAAPPEGRSFYRMLVDGLLDGMAGEGASAAEFAEHLRSFWPGDGLR